MNKRKKIVSNWINTYRNGVVWNEDVGIVHNRIWQLPIQVCKRIWRGYTHHSLFSAYSRHYSLCILSDRKHRHLLENRGKLKLTRLVFSLRSLATFLFLCWKKLQVSYRICKRTSWSWLHGSIQVTLDRQRSLFRVAENYGGNSPYSN